MRSLISWYIFFAIGSRKSTWSSSGNERSGLRQESGPGRPWDAQMRVALRLGVALRWRERACGCPASVVRGQRRRWSGMAFDQHPVSVAAGCPCRQNARYRTDVVLLDATRRIFFLFHLSFRQ